MPNITNTGKCPRGLPNGHVLDVGASASVRASVLENATMKRWVALGYITADAADVGDEHEGDEKGLLIAELAEYGVNKNRRSSVESLQTALAEAKAAAQEIE